MDGQDRESRVQPVTDPAEAARAVDELVRDALRCRALITARAAGAVRDADVLMGGYLKLRELDQDGTGGVAAAATQEAYSLVQALGFAAQYGGPAMAPTGLPAAEPRASEQLAAALGVVPAESYVPDTITFPSDRTAEAPG